MDTETGDEHGPTPSRRPRATRVVLALGGGGLAWLAWLSGLPWTLPGAARLGLGLVCLLGLIGQTLSPRLPRWARRLAHLPIAAWLLALLLGGGQWVHAASGVPNAVWVLGLVVLPPLAGLVGLAVAGSLWAMCLAAVLAWLVGLWLPVAGVHAGLLAAAWWLSVAAGMVWLLVSTRPTAPPPAPAFRLDEHLDSPDAQEGADKYTRE